jgi:LmbE family N-acetylglucosaminyl deacetylase
MSKWILLSAHFDDVVLSIGGLAWEIARRGEDVEIWTVCAGDPPADRPLPEFAQALHAWWDIGEDVPLLRSVEDAACCRVLGARSFRRYTVPDNIYRYFPGSDEAVVQTPLDNHGPLEPGESYLIPPVADFLRKNLPPGAEVAAPLAIGSHRDHVLTLRAAERLGRPLWHYADYPYLVRGEYTLSDWVPAEAEPMVVDISPDGLKAWQEGFACHRSQIRFLWPDEGEMRAAIESYWRAGYGGTLWRF